jgi:hypothetical protein
VPAVSEAALRSDLGEVAEDLVDSHAGIPEAKLACARRVDIEAAAPAARD